MRIDFRVELSWSNNIVRTQYHQLGLNQTNLRLADEFVATQWAHKAIITSSLRQNDRSRCGCGGTGTRWVFGNLV